VRCLFEEDYSESSKNAIRIFLRAMLIRGSESVLIAGMPFVRRE